MIKWVLVSLLLSGCANIPLISSTDKEEDTYMVCRGEEIVYDLSIADEETISFRKEGLAVGSYPRRDCQRLSRKTLK